jgi:hypothetical protein
MNKHEFLAALRRELTALPHGELTEQLNFYNEMIDDRMEEGMTEEDAVAGIGSVEGIAAVILADRAADGDPIPRSEKPAEEEISAPCHDIPQQDNTRTDGSASEPKGSSGETSNLRPWEILVIVLSSPLWVPLLIAAASVALSLLVTLWAVVGSLWTIPLTLGVTAVASICAVPVAVASGRWALVLAMLGAGCLLAGLCILSVFGCAFVTRGMAWLTRIGCHGLAQGVSSLASVFRKERDV